jgi:peptidoglycan hydrolase CwlO-like protein
MTAEDKSNLTILVGEGVDENTPSIGDVVNNITNIESNIDNIENNIDDIEGDVNTINSNITDI